MWHPSGARSMPPLSASPFIAAQAAVRGEHWQVNYMPVSIIVVILEGQHLDLPRKIYSHLNFQIVHLKSFIYSL